MGAGGEIRDRDNQFLVNESTSTRGLPSSEHFSLLWPFDQLGSYQLQCTVIHIQGLLLPYTPTLMNESCFWKLICTLPTSKKESDVMENLMERYVYTRSWLLDNASALALLYSLSLPWRSPVVSCDSWGGAAQKFWGLSVPRSDLQWTGDGKDLSSLTLSVTANYGSTQSLGSSPLPSLITHSLPQFLLASLPSLSNVLLFHVLLPEIISKPLVPNSLFQHLLLGGGTQLHQNYYNWYLISLSYFP